MENDEPSLEVSIVSSCPNLSIIPNKTFYNQGDQLDDDCEEVN
jgi:hypothetical protein